MRKSSVFHTVVLIFTFFCISTVAGIDSSQQNPAFSANSYEIVTRKLSIEDIEILKSLEGDVNRIKAPVVINGYGTGFLPHGDQEWKQIAESATLLIEVKNGNNYRSSVDNSNSIWFPPIGNQGSEGSCVSWATGYYCKTFQEARERNWDLSTVSYIGGWPGYPDSQLDKIMSPDFLYHQLNDGEDHGSYYSDNINLTARTGICSWQEMPYSHSDHTSWPVESAWREAPLYRSQSGFSYVYTNSSLNTIKSLLNNEQLVIIAIDAYKYPNLISINDEDLWTVEINCTENRNHANTVVGYDDDFGPYTEEGESRTGAFKIANSWGRGWNGDDDNDGFYWISYESMLQRVQYGYTFSDLNGYNPTRLAVFNMTHSEREQCQIVAGRGSSSSQEETKAFDNYIYRGGPEPFPGNSIAFDISEFDAGSEFFLKVYDNNSAGTGTINSFAIELYSGTYNPGSPDQVYSSDDTPINTINGDYVYAEVDLVNPSTATPTPDPTSSPTSTPTHTPTATNTSTNTPTNTPTDTPVPTETPSPIPTTTPTPVPTETPTPTSTPCINNGDVDLGGTLTAGDAQMAFNRVLGLITLTGEQECAADCDGNGSVTAADAQEIFFAVLGASPGCADPLFTSVFE